MGTGLRLTITKNAAQFHLDDIRFLESVKKSLDSKNKSTKKKKKMVEKMTLLTYI